MKRLMSTGGYVARGQSMSAKGRTECGVDTKVTINGPASDDALNSTSATGPPVLMFRTYCRESVSQQQHYTNSQQSSISVVASK